MMSRGMKMEDIKSEPVVQTPEASSTDVKQNDTVSYESFRKSVDAEKKARERAQALESQLEAKTNAELEAQGKHQEIIDNLRVKTQELESNLRKEREATLWNTVTSAVKQKASQEGCIDPDKLIKLFDKEDFSMLQAEEGKVGPDSLSALMEKAKRENQFLFTQSATRINDGTPSKEKPAGGKLDVSEMTPKQLEE